jgi:hypothetical protein
MNSPREPTKIQPKQEETKGLGLSPTQVAAGAGASVTSTVIASTLGTAGTLIGAALASIVSTIAAALYAHSLNKGKEKITTVRIPRLNDQEAREGTQVMTVLPPVNGPKELPEHLDPRKGKRFDIKLDRRFWTKIALAAVGMFVLVMGIITGIELVGQKPVSSIVGNTETSRSTTIGAVTNSSSSSEIEEEQEAPASPTESTPATGTSSPTTEPEEEEESEATTSARPTTSPTATPTAPTEVEEESTPEEDVSTTAVPQTTPTPPSPEE